MTESDGIKELLVKKYGGLPSHWKRVSKSNKVRLFKYHTTDQLVEVMEYQDVQIDGVSTSYDFRWVPNSEKEKYAAEIKELEMFVANGAEV